MNSTEGAAGEARFMPVQSIDAEDDQFAYRYDTQLKVYGAADSNPYHDLRHADRSTDLMSGFTVKNFTACPALTSSIDVCGVFIEAAAPVSEADAMALETLSSAGLW